MIQKSLFILFTFLVSQSALAEEYTYENISRRYSDVQMDSKAYRRAKMQGECLVGLKNLNFKKKEQFDAVAEWSSYRSFSLLSQFPPCTVLVIMEVAQEKLKITAGK